MTGPAPAGALATAGPVLDVPSAVALEYHPERRRSRGSGAGPIGGGGGLVPEGVPSAHKAACLQRWRSLPGGHAAQGQEFTRDAGADNG